MENPIKMDDLGGKPTIFGNIHLLEVFGSNYFLGIFQLPPKINTKLLPRTHCQSIITFDFDKVAPTLSNRRYHSRFFFWDTGIFWDQETEDNFDKHTLIIYT